MEAPKPQRIAKRIAAAGICSRREAERLIGERKVKVNGEVIDSPALNVSDADKIEVNNRPIFAPNATRLWLYHKPTGMLTTHKDPEGRPTVFANLPKSMPRVISVGRLDMNSEGLLLLTTNGELSRSLELPSTGLARSYRVRIFGEPSAHHIKRLKDGLTIGTVRYGPIDAVVEHGDKSNCWVQVTLHEGKNREIRRVFEHLGFKVSRLIRTDYGPFTLGTIKRGDCKEIPTQTLTRLLTPLGVTI